MIFVTVGTQLPFNRLIRALDDWAAMHPDEKVCAQIGPSSFRPQHLEHHQFLSPQQVEQLTRECRVVIAHAGMGSVLTALRYQRPIILVPRKASLGEHRNEHQLATARWLQDRPGVRVAWETEDIAALLTQGADAGTSNSSPEFAQDRLIGKLREYFSA